LAGEGKAVQVGSPYLKGAKVVCAVLGPEKGPKEVSFKYLRRKNKHWKAGHRQQLVRLKVKEISL
jgi:large subunit ribosomal protein L21